MRAAPAAKHGGKALPFGSRAQRRCGLAAGAGGRAGLTAGHSAGVALRRGVCTGVALQPGQATEPALRRGVCAGRFFGDPKMPHGRRQSMAGKRSLSAAGHSAGVALQPGTAQGWPCAGVFARECLRGALFGDPKMPHGRRQSMAGKRSLSAAGHSAGVALRPGQATGVALHGSVCAGVFARGAFRRSQNAAWPAAWYLLFSGAARGGAPEGRFLQRAPFLAPAAWAATVCPRAGCKKPGTEKTPGARPNRSLETL